MRAGSFNARNFCVYVCACVRVWDGFCLYNIPVDYAHGFANV